MDFGSPAEVSWRSSLRSSVCINTYIFESFVLKFGSLICQNQHLEIKRHAVDVLWSVVLDRSAFKHQTLISNSEPAKDQAVCVYCKQVRYLTASAQTIAMGVGNAWDSIQIMNVYKCDSIRIVNVCECSSMNYFTS